MRTSSGKIAAVRSSVIDVRFEKNPPKIHDILHVKGVAIEVLEYMDPYTVRGIAMHPSYGLSVGDLVEYIDKKERRKPRVKQENVWYGFGLFGLVGWSLTIPSLVGLSTGIVIDMAYPSRYLWSMMGLLVGVLVGCFTIYYWIGKEYAKIRRDKDDDDAVDRV